MYNRIAIFGLTGDPFTIAHRDICKQAINTLNIDKLYVIPTIVDYHRKGKDKWLTDPQKLHCMKQMLFSMGIGYYERCVIDTYELRLKNLFSTYDTLYSEFIEKRRFIHTLLEFKARHYEPSQEVLLIIGTDELRIFQSWYMWDLVLENISSLVVVNGRDGEEVEIPVPIMENMQGQVVSMPLSKSYLYNVSASAVRHWYRNDKLEDYLDDVRKIDSYEMDWITVPWIAKKKEIQENG